MVYKMIELAAVFLSFTPGSDVEDIRDIKPLHAVDLPGSWPVWSIIAAALFILGLALLLWVRRRKPSMAPAPLPPHMVALHALDALGPCDAADESRVHQYYFAISEILRQYIETSHHLNATDLTSEEILAKASTLHTLAPKHQELLKEFLHSTDAVKYARQRPSQAQVDEVLRLAKRFVRDTAYAEEPATPSVPDSSGSIQGTDVTQEA